MKIDVTYSCGHEGTVTLFGSMADRESKIKWYENTAVCPDCFQAAMRAKEESEPVKAVVSIMPGGEFEIALTGNTKPVKGEIASYGYRWGEQTGGMMDTYNRYYKKCWIKICSPDTLEADMRAVEHLVESIESNITAVDYQNAKTQYAKKMQTEKELEEIEKTKPERPACYPKGRWNGKIYSGRRVYIDNQKTTLIEKEEAEIKKYQSEYKLWKNKYDAAKKG